MTSDASAAKKPRLWLAVSNRAPRPPRPSPALDDSELLAALRDGDASAATALHDRARPMVDQTIRRLLGRHDQDFEDIAQLAMIELVYTIDRYRGDCSLDAWISTLTAHVVYKTIRRRQTERKIFGAMSPDDLVIASPRKAGREAMIRDAVKRVLVHLDAMDDSRAWTYVLHDVCGYDLKEIAQITGVTIAAAQTRLVRGRRELHERIQDDPDLASRMAELEGEP
jgi:RNA polymerase sigma-70 factor (ECF subfamily)